jgi:predicted ABC-type transport system involved in lysophospholipase L1 biosynthesis ATPase subunit
VNAPRSSLAPFAPLHHEPDPSHAREAARRAFHASGLILINPEWLGEWDRAQAQILAEKLFGKRRVNP